MNFTSIRRRVFVNIWGQQIKPRALAEFCGWTQEHVNQLAELEVGGSAELPSGPTRSAVVLARLK